jgi:hypothetical protein
MRPIVRAFALLLLLLGVACARFIDAVVTNPCPVAGRMDFATGLTPPVKSKILRSLDDELVSTEVPAHSNRLLIKGELSGDLPFPGGYGYARWTGASDYVLFRIRPSETEPVAIVVPKSACP